MKRIATIIVVLSLILVLGSNAYALETNVQSESINRIELVEKSVTSFLLSVGEKRPIEEPIYLYNFGEEIEAVLYPIDDSGYVVVSYKDGHVVEYSPESCIDITRVLKNNRIYYGGPLAFFVEAANDKGFLNAISGSVVESVPSDYYDVDYDESALMGLSKVTSNTFSISSSPQTLSAPSNYVSALTTNGWYCTITGITNMLQYYSDEYSADVYCSTVSSISGLRTALNSNGYIYNGPLLLSKAAESHPGLSGTYLGLRSYLSRSDVTTYSVITTTVTSARVKNLILASCPSLLTIYTTSLNSSSSSSDTHVVMCYGYHDVASGVIRSDQDSTTTTYYIVNDGWGNNGVYVCADDIPVTFEMLYMQ